jgi:hypothetical protein
MGQLLKQKQLALAAKTYQDGPDAMSKHTICWLSDWLNNDLRIPSINRDMVPQRRGSATPTVSFPGPKAGTKVLNDPCCQVLLLVFETDSAFKRLELARQYSL